MVISFPAIWIVDCSGWMDLGSRPPKQMAVTSHMTAVENLTFSIPSDQSILTAQNINLIHNESVRLDDTLFSCSKKIIRGVTSYASTKVSILLNAIADARALISKAVSRVSSNAEVSKSSLLVRLEQPDSDLVVEQAIEDHAIPVQDTLKISRNKRLQLKKQPELVSPVSEHQNSAPYDSHVYVGFPSSQLNCFANAAIKVLMHALTQQDIEKLKTKPKLDHSGRQAIRDHLIDLWTCYHQSEIKTNVEASVLNLFKACQAIKLVSKHNSKESEKKMNKETYFDDLHPSKQGCASEFLRGILSIIGCTDSLQSIMSQDKRVLGINDDEWELARSKWQGDPLYEIKLDELETLQSAFDSNKPKVLEYYTIEENILNRMFNGTPKHLDCMSTIKEADNIWLGKLGKKRLQKEMATRNQGCIKIHSQYCKIYNLFSLPQGSQGFFVGLTVNEGQRSSLRSRQSSNMNAMRQKIQNSGDLSLTLPVKQFNESILPEKFVLKSVVIHSGISQNSGHYVAYIQHEDGRIYQHNDAHVSLSSDITLKDCILADLLTSKPRILYYQKAPNG